MNRASQRRTTLITLITALILIALAASDVSAQAQTLSVGDTVTGTISDSGYQVSYKLSITASGAVTFSMIADNTLNCHLVLQDAAGKNTLAESNDGSTGHNAYLEYSFGQAGQYTLIATRYGGQNGLSIGGYTLSVKAGNAMPATTATATPTTTPTGTLSTSTPAPLQPTLTPSHTLRPSATPREFVEGGEIASGDVAAGTIDDLHIAYRYTFQGEVGQQLTVTMTGEDDLQPALALLFGDQLDTLESVAAHAGATSVVLDYVLPENGPYTIMATRDKKAQGTTSGPFTLMVAAADSIGEIAYQGTPDKIITGLQAKGLVPTGGKLLFTQTAGTTLHESAPGYTNAPIGGGVTAIDFVLSYQIVSGTGGDRFGCGVGFWQTGDKDYGTVWFTRQGRANLVQFQDGDLLMRFSKQSDLFVPKGVSTVTVVAAQDKVSVYFNGMLAAIAKGYPVKGTFSAELYNPPDNNDVTSCSFQKGWVWTFDK